MLQEQWDSLLLKQRELEDSCMAQGAKRFKKRLTRAVETERQSTFGAAKRLLTGGLEPLEASLTEWLVSARPGPQHCSIKWLRLLCSPTAAIQQFEEKRKRVATDVEKERITARSKAHGIETAAFMTLKVVLDGIDQRRQLYAVANTISDLITDELRFRRFNELAPRLFEYKMAHFHTSSYSYMARSLDGSLEGLRCAACLHKVEGMTLSEKRREPCEHMMQAFDDLTISQNHRYLVGVKLLDILMHSTGLVECVTDLTPSKGRRRVKERLIVSATEGTMEWLSKRNSILETLTPIHLPMVIPPLQWGPGGERGGYRFALRSKHRLVRGLSKTHEATVEGTSMPIVYEAINAIQNTAWRVNTAVLNILQSIKDNGGGLAGVPRYDHEPLPPKPYNISDMESREAEFSRVDWKRKTAKVRTLNKLREREMIAFNRRLDMVSTVKDADAIFFPHTLDFRGRVYPIPTTISPQGDDVAKGLLTFALGRPVGIEGGRWLAVHGANCLGEWMGRKTSKMTLDERRDLMHSLTGDMQKAASDPIGFSWWAEADEPVQFLAFLVEWTRWAASNFDPEFVSTLPVNVDGTCNGLQHFSAMLRDEVGGRTVNLIPLSTPQDVYERIAERTLDLMQAEAGTSEYARLWLTSGLVKRKLAKTPTMTFVYGSKKYGFQEQLCEYVQKLSKNPEEAKALYEGVKTHFTVNEEPEIVQACGYLAGKIWDGLQDTLIAASAAMDWLQRSARVVIQAGKGVKWTVPVTGFPVSQEYYQQQIRQISTILAGRVIRPALYSPTVRIENHKQTNAIAPNVVHSLDAAALQLTIAQASRDGVEQFSAIHDSYGCLAGDMPILIRATRQAFVTLYTQHDVIGMLHASFLEQAREEDRESFPQPPVSGELDVAQVLISDYFFS